MLKGTLVHSNHYRRTLLVTCSTCETRSVTRGTHFSTRNTRLPTRTTRLSTRSVLLFTRNTCLVIRLSICCTGLSALSTRSTICLLFYN